MSSVLDLEEEMIELQIEEVILKRKLNELKLKRLEAEIPEKKPVVSSIDSAGLQLHYCNSTKERMMRIADVNADGSIEIFGKHDSTIIAKQYNVQTLKWICKKLPAWSKRQKTEKRFFDNIAKEYSKRFIEISEVTIEKLCYLVDSGMFDVWFEKYHNLRSKQEVLV